MLHRLRFVTGTDTGVGKTWVTAGLARRARARGLRVAALKAIESGCRRAPDGSGALIGEDDEALVEAAGAWQGPEDRCRCLFEPALAPGVVADDLGVRIDLDAIEQQARSLVARTDLTLVEGAGGWTVPLGAGRTISDLARRLAAPVVIVGRAGLGTINHSVLTVRAVAADGLEIAAVVLSRQATDDLATARRNAAEIRSQTGATVVVSDELDRVLDRL